MTQLRVLWALFRRRLHLWASFFLSWLSGKRSCGNWDYEMLSSGYDKPRTMIVACLCGKEFYRDPDFTLKNEEVMRQAINRRIRSRRNSGTIKSHF